MSRLAPINPEFIYSIAQLERIQGEQPNCLIKAEDLYGSHIRINGVIRLKQSRRDNHFRYSGYRFGAEGSHPAGITKNRPVVAIDGRCWCDLPNDDGNYIDID